MINLTENTEALEDVLIAYILYRNDDYILMDESGCQVEKTKLLYYLQPSFFSSKLDRDIIDQIKSFYRTYNNIPSLDEIKHVMSSKGMEYSDSDFRAIEGVNLFSFTKEYLYESLHTYLLTKTISYQFNKVTQKLSTMKPNPQNINSIFEYVRGEMSSNLEVDITRNNMGLSVYDYTAHIQNKKQTTPTGMEYLDIVLGGGWEPKTLIVFFGRPKVGKSLVISNLAVRAAAGGTNVGIYSVELGDRKYMKRVGSNLFEIPYTNYNYYVDEQSTLKVKEGIEKYKTKFPNAGDIHIKEAPTGSSTVYDIENYFLKLQQQTGRHYDVIFVDYVNLLRDVDNETNMYLKIKKICEGLRKIAQRNNWCVVTATQANKQNFTNDDLGLDAVAESAGLVATVDTLIGLSSQANDKLKMKTVANRDNGHMGSNAMFKKEFEYYRLKEDGANYISDLDMDEEKMKEEILKEYDPTKAKGWTPDDNTDFKIEKKKESNVEVKEETETKPSDIEFDKDERDIAKEEVVENKVETKIEEQAKPEISEDDPLSGINHFSNNNSLEDLIPDNKNYTFNEEESEDNTDNKVIPVAWSPDDNTDFKIEKKKESNVEVKEKTETKPSDIEFDKDERDIAKEEVVENKVETKIEEQAQPEISEDDPLSGINHFSNNNSLEDLIPDNKNYTFNEEDTLSEINNFGNNDSLEDLIPDNKDLNTFNEEESEDNTDNKVIPVAWSPDNNSNTVEKEVKAVAWDPNSSIVKTSEKTVEKEEIQNTETKEVIKEEYSKVEENTNKKEVVNNFMSEYLVNGMKTKEEHDSLIHLDAANVGMSVLTKLNKEILGS